MRITRSLLALTAVIFTAAAPAVRPAGPASIALTSGWSQIKEGEAVGAFEQDAVLASHPAPHLLHISETKQADPGRGRVGVSNSAVIPVTADKWYDITFNGNVVTAPGIRPSIGLVFSLESKDGTVLARTTLPEIGSRGGGGRGRGRGATTAPGTAPAVPWNKYLVSLHARASDPAAHLTITPIEVTNVYLENLTIVERP